MDAIKADIEAQAKAISAAGGRPWKCEVGRKEYDVLMADYREMQPIGRVVRFGPGRWMLGIVTSSGELEIQLVDADSGVTVV